MNQHYAFWVAYYEGLTETENPNLEAKNRRLTDGARWGTSFTRFPLTGHPDYRSFLMCTQYPGLALGLGTTHISGKSSEDGSEVQLGISLDYVSGLPAIPGASVKGLLRSAFLWHRELTKELLQTEHPLTNEDLKQLELSIFGTRHPYDPEKAAAGKNEARSQGVDCFLDAWPVRAAQDQRLLGMDYVTPHLAKTREYQGLTGPNINAFLKVMPDVVYEFRFLLKDSKIREGLTVSADAKRALFQSLMETLGVGAKTNTGYGYLRGLQGDEAEKLKGCALVRSGDCTVRLHVKDGKSGKKNKSSAQRQPGPVNVKTVQNKNELQLGDLIMATVTKAGLGSCEVRLCKGAEATMKASRLYGKGETVKVRVIGLKPNLSVTEVP